MWVLAVAGILSKVWHGHQYPRLSLASYLLCFTVGAAFYAAKKKVFHHVIWHFFVLAGAACHFLAVVWYVLPV